MKPSHLLRLTLAVAFLFSGILSAADQNAKAKKPAEKSPVSAQKKPVEKKPGPPTDNSIHLVFEFIEVRQEDLSDWVFENRLGSDAGDLRKEVWGWVKKKDAAIVDTVILNARSGQRAKSESIEEIIYPTEYDPAKVPTDTDVRDGAEIPITPPSPAAFETRNAGVSVEVDPVLSDDGKTIDLNLAPEIVQLIRMEEWTTESAGVIGVYPVPVFYTAKVTTQITLKTGAYGLVGTVRLPEPVKEQRDDPIVLIFVRGETG